MFCPRCAAQNLDDAKFCRACGTNLEPIALALRGQHQPVRAGELAEETWAEKRREGIKKLVRAGGLLPSSLLIGVALGLFSNEPDWIIVWMVFCGWMATWGIFSLVSGTQLLLESKYTREDVSKNVSQTNQLWHGPERESLPAAPTTFENRSVTEHTTRSLVERPPAEKNDSPV